MGRKKEYNEEEVLEKAMICFWHHGYLNTSIRQLEQEMGINQFSIYSSFGSKENLYQRVLENYVTMMQSSYLLGLSHDDADIFDIQHFLLKFGAAMVNKKIPSSCLMVQSMIAYEIFSPYIQASIDSFSKLMESIFAKALSNSQAKDLIPRRSSIKSEAQYLLGITQSLSLVNKKSNKSELESYIKNSIMKIMR